MNAVQIQMTAAVAAQYFPVFDKTDCHQTLFTQAAYLLMTINPNISAFTLTLNAQRWWHCERVQHANQVVGLVCRKEEGLRKPQSLYWQ